MSGMRTIAVALVACAAAAPAAAKLVEEKIMVPVRATGIDGREVSQSIVVTLFHDSAAAKPYPVLVINHGRSPHAEERTTPAGRFVASLDRDVHGQEVLWVDYDAAISMHRAHPSARTSVTRSASG